MGRVTVNKPFLGVDGEGVTLPDGTHHYNLLRAGRDVLENEDGSELRWEQIFSFLTDIPQNTTPVGYSLNYDVTMWLRGVREERVRRLLDREKRTTPGFKGPLPVDIADWSIDWLPNKEFKIKRQGKPWVRISDTWTFFQSSFVSALEKWDCVESDIVNVIREGKEKRAVVEKIDDEVRYYNDLEMSALETLMTTFKETCSAIGYVPRLWQGPGNLAAAMFQKHNIPKTETYRDIIPSQVWTWAQAAYYGGRFETTAVGNIAGPIYQYDINSAYPAAIAQLPCLLHGIWEKRSVRPTDEKYWIAYCGFGHGKKRSLCNLPIRLDDGSIRYPHNGRGWYWSVEIQAAEAAGTTTYCDSGYWVLKETCHCQPFAWVRMLYLMRLALGKAAKGLALKLALNSLYGKMAQSVGVAPYGNPIYASLITAMTRALLIGAYSQAPDHCYMLATDGIFMGSPVELKVGDQLGEWDLKVHEDGMFIIQPGLYVAGNEKPKTRGVPLRLVLERVDRFRHAWDEYTANPTGQIPYVKIPVRNFIGLSLAVARNKFRLAGEWLPDNKNVSFDWMTKRRPNSLALDDRGWRTFPYKGYKDDITLPYSKFIGGMSSPERMNEIYQPEWLMDIGDVDFDLSDMGTFDEEILNTIPA